MRKLAMLLAALMALFSTAVMAQDGQPQEEITIQRLVAPPGATGELTPWREIGRAPFLQTAQRAGELHAMKSEVSAARYMEGVNGIRSGTCEMEYYLQNGDVLLVTFTDSSGVSHSMLMVVDFPYAADDPRRRARVCIMDDGTTVVYPYECENWSLASADYSVRVRYDPPAPTQTVRVFVPSVTTNFTPRVQASDGDSLVLPLFVPGPRYASGDTVLRSGSVADSSNAVNAGASACATAVSGTSHSGC